MNAPFTISEELIEQPVSPDAVLTDQQLMAGGLSLVTNWERTETSRNAVRARRAKEKKAKTGLKQVNVYATEDAMEIIRAVAKASPAQLTAVRQALDGVPVDGPTPTLSWTDSEAIKLCRVLLDLDGWRYPIVYLLLWLVYPHEA